MLLWSRKNTAVSKAAWKVQLLAMQMLHKNNTLHFIFICKRGNKSHIGISSQSHPGEDKGQSVCGCSCRCVPVPALSAQPPALLGQLVLLP